MKTRSDLEINNEIVSILRNSKIVSERRKAAIDLFFRAYEGKAPYCKLMDCFVIANIRYLERFDNIFLVYCDATGEYLTEFELKIN